MAEKRKGNAMSDQPMYHSDFGSTEALINYIKEKADDIEFVEIPQSPYLTRNERNVVIGMILHCVNDEKVISPRAAETLLNDGLLNRMSIKIKLVNQMSQ